MIKSQQYGLAFELQQPKAKKKKTKKHPTTIVFRYQENAPTSTTLKISEAHSQCKGFTVWRLEHFYRDKLFHGIEGMQILELTDRLNCKSGNSIIIFLLAHSTVGRLIPKSS